jgi:phospholipase/carboxylesterase
MDKLSYKHDPFDFKVERKSQDIYLIPKKSHTETIIWLHGLGDTAEGFLDVFDSEMNPLRETTKVVLLTAPVSPVTINFGMSMPSWYDIKVMGIVDADPKNFSKCVSLEDVDKNSKRIRSVMEEEVLWKKK